jgi:comEA protein
MLDLTTAEKRVMLILATVIISAGFFKSFQPFTEKNDQYDYSVSDSVFSRLSHQSRLISSDNHNAPLKVETETSVHKGKVSEPPERSIHINQADEAELKKLPRIGPAMAKRIIKYRKEKGPFRSLDDLTKIKGIGKKTLEKLRPYLIEIK